MRFRMNDAIRCSASWSRAGICIAAAMAFVACGRHGSRDMARYFERSVEQRLTEIDRSGNDSVAGAARQVDKRVGELVLISKDIENLGASVRLSNEAFAGWSKSLGMNPADFETLSTQMHADEIEVLLRKNELDLLNQLLLRSAGSHSLFTAQ